MKIYTKRGDEGQTGLFGGERVAKDHLRIHAYGTLDELNAVLGLTIAEATQSGGKPLADLAARLLRIQGELFQIGAELATPRGKTVSIALVGQSHVETLEKEIDAMEAKLEPLKTFILPGGARISAQLHIARTVSRRAEREVVTLSRGQAQRSELLQYVNRLSDYLFVCARFANHLAKVADSPWHAPGHAPATE